MLEPFGEPEEPSAASPKKRRRKRERHQDRGGFQPAGTAWSANRLDVSDLLRDARQVEMRSIYYGSNACYLVVLAHPDAGRSLAVYKPARGEYPLWDFPQGTLYRREVASYRVAALLGWEIVPPTVIGSGRFGLGSVQLFLEESAETAVAVASLRRLILLDWVVNNADRKPDHVLVGEGGHLWGIDHGLTFHAHPKLRTVFWHFAGERLAEDEVRDLERLRDRLDSSEGECVRELLSVPEVRALNLRVAALINGGVFPDPQNKAMPYRW